jgi:hypothetical protein
MAGMFDSVPRSRARSSNIDNGTAAKPAVNKPKIKRNRPVPDNEFAPGGLTTFSEREFNQVIPEPEIQIETQPFTESETEDVPTKEKTPRVFRSVTLSNEPRKPKTLSKQTPSADQEAVVKTRDMVIAILTSAGRQHLTIGQIRNLLAEQGLDRSYRAVRKMLIRLVETGVIIWNQ